MTKSFGWLAHRRFSDFVWLRERLLETYPGVLVPPLPDKKFFGRFETEFIEKRKEALERFLNKCTLHPRLRVAEALRFFLEKRDDPDGTRSTFEAEKVKYERVLPRVDPQLYTNPRVVEGDVMIVLMPIVNYLVAMQDYLQGLERMTASLEQRRREEADELQRMGQTFGSLFACADDGAYCWRKNCQDCETVGKQMQSLGRRSARVSTVVDDCGANIYNAVWRSVLDELDIVVSLREQIDMRVILDAEYRLAVSQLKQLRVKRAQVLASGGGGKGKNSTAAKLEQAVLSEEATCKSLKFRLDYVTTALLVELDTFHNSKPQKFSVMLNHYATQSAFAAEQLHQAWADVLKANEAIAAENQ
mmetsp:Transcript_12765/g.21686  ORF Transcript_12765/g.21686 Transcript_12765/m.21686 type:complete len:360 (-) Transcript_12765:33-1112(-)